MIESIYTLLSDLGYAHPLHPAVTHLPMGMVMGGFLFTAIAFVFKQAAFYKTAHHCVGLALVGIPPTVLLGYMDWQYTFGGKWLTQIKIKFLLAVVITLLLGVAYRWGSNAEASPKRMLVLNGVILGTAIGLGFFGGELLLG